MVTRVASFVAVLLALLILGAAHRAHAAVVVTGPGITCTADPRLQSPTAGLDFCFQSTTNDLRRWSGAIWEPIVSSGVSSINSLTGALSLLGTTNQIGIVSGGTTITIGTPQDIAPGSSPAFLGLTVSGLGSPSTRGNPVVLSSAGTLHASSYYTDVREFGAICNGTNQAAPIEAAISAGKTRVFIPSGCLWVPTADLIPGNVEIIGEDWNTVTIQSSSPASTNVSLGNNTVVRNVRIKHANCLAAPGAPEFCPTRYYQNNSGAARDFANWPNQPFAALVGGTDQGSSDRPGVYLESFGDGDPIFVQTNAAAAAINVFGRGTGGAGGNPALNIGRFTPAGGVNIYTNDAAATSGYGLQIGTSHQTSGSFITLSHSVSSLSGAAITANVAQAGGTFTGWFLLLQKNSATRAAIIDTGAFQSFAQEAYQAHPYGTSAGNTGEFRAYELVANGTNYVGWKAPDSVTTTTVNVFPPAPCAVNESWLSDGGSPIQTWSCGSGGGGSGITSLNGLVASSQTFVNGDNVTMVSAGSTHTITWISTLATALGGFGADMSAASGAISFNAGARVVNNVLTADRILYAAAGNTLVSSANLTFNGTTLILGGITPASTECLQIDNTGAVGTSGATCGGGGGAGVDSLNGEVGALTLVGVANRTTVTTLGSTITVSLPNPIEVGTTGNAATATTASGLAGGSSGRIVVWSGATSVIGTEAFKWDNLNNVLNLNANASGIPNGPTGTLMRVAGADGAGVYMTVDSYGTGAAASGYQGRRSRGTAAAPAAVQTDDALAILSGFGYGATAYSTTARGSFGIFAAETWTDSAQGTIATVGIVPPGSTTLTEKVRVSSVGLTLANALTVPNGGTGLTSGTSGGVPYFSGATALASSLTLTNHGMMVGGGSGAAPRGLTALTNGQLYLGSTGADPVPSSLTSSTIAFTPGAGALTLDVTGIFGGVAGRVPYWTSATAVGNDATFTFDPTNKRLSVGATTTAAVRMVVQDNVTAGGMVKLQSSHAASGDAWWIGFTHGTSSADANDRARIGVNIQAGGAGRLTFSTGFAGAVSTRMFIDEGGNTGINTSTPLSRFQVDGRATLADSTSSQILALMGNAYYDGGDKYLSTAAAGRLLYSPGFGYWAVQTAPSGAANAAVMYTDIVRVYPAGARFGTDLNPTYPDPVTTFFGVAGNLNVQVAKSATGATFATFKPNTRIETDYSGIRTESEIFGSDVVNLLVRVNNTSTGTPFSDPGLSLNNAFLLNLRNGFTGDTLNLEVGTDDVDTGSGSGYTTGLDSTVYGQNPNRQHSAIKGSMVYRSATPDATNRFKATLWTESSTMVANPRFHGVIMHNSSAWGFQSQTMGAAFGGPNTTWKSDCTPAPCTPQPAWADFLRLTHGIALELTDTVAFRVDYLGQLTTSPQVDSNAQLAAVGLSGGVNGANLKLAHTGVAGPNKYLRSNAGNFEIMNSAYNARLMTLTDAGGVAFGGMGSTGAPPAGSKAVCTDSNRVLYVSTTNSCPP